MFVMSVQWTYIYMSLGLSVMCMCSGVMCICMCMYVCAFVCMCICMCICMYPPRCSCAVHVHVHALNVCHGWYVVCAVMSVTKCQSSFFSFLLSPILILSPSKKCYANLTLYFLEESKEEFSYDRF